MIPYPRLQRNNGAGGTPTLNPVLVTEVQAQWGRIARGFYGAWPLYTTDAHAVIELNQGLSKHVYGNFDIIF